jgi:DinB superfamily
MSYADIAIQMLEFTRMRTLMTLDEIAKLPDPAAVLSWQPGLGRAHIGWQLTHIGITEELTATERLCGTTPCWPDLVPRFKFGSVPDQNVPDIGTIRKVLEESRAHLVPVLAGMKDEELDIIPAWYTERGWSQRRILQIMNWHEAHHQGQAHITFNLWKASQQR